jgi:hypothetical protein
MTDYRITICKYHDLGQFKYCFTCGSPLIMVEGTLTCSKSWVHIRIFLEECENHEDCDVEKVFE